MSDAAPAPASQPKKQSKAVSMVIAVVAVIGIVVGISKLTRGLSEIFGGLREEVRALIDESDSAYRAAFEQTQKSDAEYGKLIEAFNGKTLEEVRADHQAELSEVGKGLSDVAERFGVAAAKLDQALTKEMPENTKANLVDRAKMLSAFAEGYGHKAKSIAMMADASITDRDALIVAMNELNAKADAAFKIGNDLTAKLTDAAKEMK